MDDVHTDHEATDEYSPDTNALRTILEKVYFHRLPSYGNTIFYGLGFLALTCLVLLGISGLTLAFMGQNWWLFTPWGIYVRSVHLWTVQAFIFILILHGLVGFTTSGFRKPRRMVWVFGATIFCLALIQTEFGYGLRGDFASQFRAVSGADFWNGAYLGYWLNPLNYSQTFLIHVALIPLAIFVLFIAHYLLEHTYGIAKPYRSDISYTMEAADHRIMYARGIALLLAIFTLAFFFHSPYVPAVRIADIARARQPLVTTTLLQEFDRTSGTATYLDSIDPYSFDTRQVYVVSPYETYRASERTAVAASGTPETAPDAWKAFANASPSARRAYVAQAYRFASSSDQGRYATSSNPVISMLQTLIPMTKSGLYESLLDAENPSINYTYSLRFLDDMGIPEERAATLHMSTVEWGMVKDETGSIYKLPPGSWWLMPLAVSNYVFDLPDKAYGDRDAAEILGVLVILAITFPYIPYLNQLPEKLDLAPFIWRRRRR